MEDIDGGLHPAVDGQSLDEDEDIGTIFCVLWVHCLVGYLSMNVWTHVVLGVL